MFCYRVFFCEMLKRNVVVVIVGFLVILLIEVRVRICFLVLYIKEMLDKVRLIIIILDYIVLKF